MISHLRMEGKYLLFTDQVPTNKHFHLFFKLDDGSTLVYQDVRKFGTFDLLAKSQEEAYFTRKKLGPEPTKKAFKYALFERALISSAKPIKSLLLEQKLVAGLGNIYVDEVLWAAKVHPEMPAKELSKAAMKRVHDQTIAILQLGIEKGELKKAKETALSLAEMGLSVDKIAQAVKINVDTVREWIDGNV